MPDDPHDAPEDETPGQRRARLMNLNNEGWHPDKVAKVDEVPPPVKEEPKPVEAASESKPRFSAKEK